MDDAAKLSVKDEAFNVAGEASRPDAGATPARAVASKSKRGGARPGAGRRPKVPPTPGTAPAPQSDEEKRAAEIASATATINGTATALAFALGGEECVPSDAERAMLDTSLSKYMEARGVVNCPPELMLVVVYGQVFGPKLVRSPSAAEKGRMIWGRVKSWCSRAWGAVARKSK